MLDFNRPYMDEMAEDMHAEVFDFYVDEAKRTVVATLRVPVNALGTEALDIINKSCMTHMIFPNVNIAKNMLLKGTYKGKAVCAPTDTFNEEVGIQIAKLRAIREYNRDRRDKVAKMTRIFADVAQRFERANEYSDYAIKNINKGINETLDEYENR